MSYWQEVDAKRQAERDFDRRGRPDREMYDRYGSDSQRAYTAEFDRHKREDERLQEERREEERLAERSEAQRIERQREEQRQFAEAEYYARLEALEVERQEAENHDRPDQ